MKLVLNMRSKIFLLALIVNVLAIILISTLFYQKSTEFFDKQYAKSLSERLYVGTKNIDKAFQNIYHSTIELSFNDDIKSIVLSENTNDLNKLSNILKNYKEKNFLIDNIYCYIPDKNILVKAEEYNSIQSIKKDISDKWLNIISNQQGMKPLFTKDIFSSSNKSVYLYKSLMVNDEKDTIAYIVFTMNERALYYNYLDDIVRDGDSVIYMFDNLGNIVSANKLVEQENADNLFSVIKKTKLGQTDIDIQDNTYLGVYNVAPFSKYSFFLAVDKNIFFKEIFFIQAIIIICSIIIMSISAVIIYFMAIKLNKPIEELAKAMRKASRGDLSIKAKVHGRDEIGRLAVIFNYMISRINKLIDDLANEKALKKQAQLNALQYQIRPHFIYNTLNAIRFTAMMQGAKNIGNLLGNFIDLLQVSTNRKGEFALVKEELTTLKNYIALQEFRMMDTFKVEFEIEDKVLNYYIPRLILQPLVENSIIHGPSEQRRFCNIIVRAYENKDSLFLEVEDNGKGMSQEQMQGFIDLENKTSGGYSSIGVFNIKERLRLYYKEKGVLKYFSDNKTYTKAQIQLPIAKNINKYKL